MFLQLHEQFTNELSRIEKAVTEIAWSEQSFATSQNVAGVGAGVLLTHMGYPSKPTSHAPQSIAGSNCAGQTEHVMPFH